MSISTAQIATPSPSEPKLDRRRYRRVVFFFGRMFVNILWWEVAVRHVLGKRAAERGRKARVTGYARSFRDLAVVMGGVMIKLGQFVSTRVDVMPPEITSELADLQDEVPPAPLDEMLIVIKEELTAAPDALFAEFHTEVQAAASLGQVYRATLKTGERVAVKVQRPGIERVVATDLEALKVVSRWAMLWPVINRRADVPALMQEFARTLWEELDYEAEARNAQRFMEMFAEDRRVYIPIIYPEFSRRRVLTLEDVTSIKINDKDAIEAAGVDRATAARWLLDVYLRMIFEEGFYHADPHPGNLFIYPLPEQPPSDDLLPPPAPETGRPFYVIFVDFGMVGTVTPQVKAGLREALIAVVTRDSSRMLKAYQVLGVLLPSADVKRIEEAETEALNIIWGKSVPEMAQMPREEMHNIAMKYRDLLYEMPFQVPQNFIYLARAIGILSGICTMLDPDFNPWEQVAKYAERIVSGESGDILKTIVKEATSLGQVAIALPGQLQDVLGRVQRGDALVQIDPGPGLQLDLRRLESSINGLTRALVFASLLIVSTLLLINGRELPGEIGLGISALSWIALLLRPRPRR